MRETESSVAMAMASQAVALPLRCLWFLIRHPMVALILTLLLAFSAFSFLAHYNEAIAERFNSSMKYFLGATLAAEGSNALRSRIDVLEADIKAKNATLARKNKSLRSAAKTLEHNKEIFALGRNVIRNQKNQLIEHRARLDRFSDRGNKLVAALPKRFSKVAIYDSAGELVGWLPIVGDIASIGLAAGGIYEMCQMFREIEGATEELGVPYLIYTDTFCEKPAEKTKEVIADSAGQVKDSVTATVIVLADKASDVSSSATERVLSFVDKSIETLKNLI